MVCWINIRSHSNMNLLNGDNLLRNPDHFMGENSTLYGALCEIMSVSYLLFPTGCAAISNVLFLCNDRLGGGISLEMKLLIRK